ncbi:MAG: hypothetical protein AB7E84_21110 [Xanthobacteraceae bacterium]
MSIQKIHLRKLLMLMFASNAQRTSVLRADIRDEVRKARGIKGDGGDFHVPFWHDAKKHVNGEKDLHISVAERIASHKGRERLYAELRDGFLDWWNHKRRWTNEPSTSEMLSVRGAVEFPNLGATVKVENLLALTIGGSRNRIIYPYFAEEPKLTADMARLGLWAITESVLDYPTDEFRILDVIRGRSYAVSDLAFSGGEEAEFIRLYSALLVSWKRLWEEYEPA